MAKLSKRKQQIQAKVESAKSYEVSQAMELLKELTSGKFLESVDVAVNLGVDPRKSDQVVRSSSVLPHGTGKNVRVAVFAQGQKAEDAKAAGADIVGFEDLAESIQAGDLNFDVVIASPDAMRIVGRLGTILGPRGLMPNPKVGTVTPDITNAGKNAKSGQVRFRTDKNGIIHCSIGKLDFNDESITENLNHLLADLKKAKPSSAKGVYFKKVTLSSTMGPGLSLDLGKLSV